MPVLITGCGHSGTRWMVRVLRLCGVNAHHETAFSTAFHENAVSQCEVSWTAPAFADVAREHFPARIFLRRHPLAIVRSFLAERWFDSQAGQHQRLVHAAIGPSDPVHYVVRWSAMCKRLCQYELRLESITTAELVSLVSLCGGRVDDKTAERALKTPPITTRRPSLTMADAMQYARAHPLYHDLQRLADEGGYDMEAAA